MATLIVTVVPTFAGYPVTYLNGVRPAQRQARLARANRELGDSATSSARGELPPPPLTAGRVTSSRSPSPGPASSPALPAGPSP